MILVALSLFMAIVLCAAGFYCWKDTSNTRLDEMLQDELAEVDQDNGDPLDVSRSDSEKQGLPFLDQLHQEALQAGLSINPIAMLGTMVVGGLALFLVLYLMTDNLVISMFGVVGGMFAPRAWLRREKENRQEALSEQLNDTLMMMGNGLRSNLTFQQVTKRVADEMNPPIADEFALASRMLRLGRTPAEAMEALEARIGLRDFHLVVLATKIQTEMGGDLAGALENIAQTVRGRHELRQTVAAATAQGRMTATLLSVMPFVLIGVVLMVQPEYLDLFMDNIYGRILLLLLLSMIPVGWMVINRIVDVKLD